MAHPDRLIRKQLRTSYVVTTAAEETFNGVLTDADANWLVFVNAKALTSDGKELAVDGELWLPRASIKYLQHI